MKEILESKGLSLCDAFPDLHNSDQVQYKATAREPSAYVIIGNRFCPGKTLG